MRGRKFIDLTGHKYSRLSVLSCAGLDGNGKNSWLCKCDCGKDIVVRGGSLRNGHTRSCGCLQRELVGIRTAKLMTKHGQSYTTEYVIYAGMKQRCYNPKNKKYKDYGARGLTVCARWLESFENFYADMGPRPSKNHSIERKNNDLGYSPENCHWGTYSEQNKNQRRWLKNS